MGTIMYNLNKENFWDKIKEKYPEAFEHFSAWINDYKVEIGWGAIFNGGVKFHDLPFEMQNGILARFDIEKFHGKLGYAKIFANEARRMENLFADVQAGIRNRNIKLN